ncbi:hypothetical protein O0L34_g14149 [Tuta absoluta]|nr:hypothetical protein O0L34_g14149 [Tuta absoluta]
MKVFIFLCFLSLAALTASAPYGDVTSKPHYDLEDAEELFEKFQKDYGKTYDDEDDKQIHFEAFKKTLDIINKVNDDPNGTWVADINYTADYTPEEIKKLMGAKLPQEAKK